MPFYTVPDIARTILNVVPDPIVIFEVVDMEKLRLVQVNNAAISVGITDDQIGKYLEDTFNCGNFKRIEHLLKKAILYDESVKFQNQIWKDPVKVVLEIIATPVNAIDGKSYLIIVAREITNYVNS